MSSRVSDGDPPPGATATPPAGSPAPGSPRLLARSAPPPAPPLIGLATSPPLDASFVVEPSFDWEAGAPPSPALGLASSSGEEAGVPPASAPPAPPPAGLPPCGAPLSPDAPRPLLRSVVVGDLGSLFGTEELPVPQLGKMPVARLDPVVLEVSKRPRPPPPPDRLPPNFQPQVLPLPADEVEGDFQPQVLPRPADEVVGDELGWQEVRNRRRPRCSPPLPPPRGGEDRALAFKRRVRGRCFRCLAPDHRIAGCHGKIRCLACHCSGHRERDCWQRQVANQASPCSVPLAAAPLRPLDRSWVSVAAPAAAHGGLPPTSRHESASPTATQDVMQRSFLEGQVMLMRAEMRDLVVSQLEKMAVSRPERMEPMQSLMERLGSLLERIEAALDRLSMVPAVVQGTPAPPPPLSGIEAALDRISAAPLSGIDFSCRDGGLELFGCSPRNATNPASLLALATTPLVVSECVSPEVQAMPNLQALAVETVVPLSLQELMGFGAPSSEERSPEETVQIVVGDPLEKASPFSAGELCHELAGMTSGSPNVMQVGEDGQQFASVTQVDKPPISLEEFLKNVTCVLPSPLLGTPPPVQMAAENATRTARRSGRLDKKKRSCNIPTAKRAEFRLMEAFGELPEMNKDEVAESKVQTFQNMCKKPLSSQAMAAIHSLVGIGGKGKMDFSDFLGGSPLDNVSS